MLMIHRPPLIRAGWMDHNSQTKPRYCSPLNYGSLAEKRRTFPLIAGSTRVLATRLTWYRMRCLLLDGVNARRPWWSMELVAIVSWPTWYVVRTSDTLCWCIILIYRSIWMHTDYEGKWQDLRWGKRWQTGKAWVNQQLAAIQSNSSLNSAPIIYPFSSVYPIYQPSQTEVDIREKWCLRRWSIGTTFTIILSSYFINHRPAKVRNYSRLQDQVLAWYPSRDRIWRLGRNVGLGPYPCLVNTVQWAMCRVDLRHEAVFSPVIE
jgi:hypothetical protein